MQSNPLDQLRWQPQSQIRGNLAMGNLRENMLRFLRTERGVHAETLMTAMGALTGFAAQNAALIRAATATSSLGQGPFDGLVLVGGEPGNRYLAGNWINAHLFDEIGSVFPLWGFMAAAVLDTGVPLGDLAEIGEIARYVASSLGTADYGRLRAPMGHEPGLPPNELLRRLWPLVLQIFALPIPPEFSEKSKDEPLLEEAHWPIIVSNVTAQFIRMTKDALDPRLSFALAMESAVISCKVDPEWIEPGKWDIRAVAGRLTVRRVIN